MRYLALATDYDGTIATHGVVDPHTLHSLQRVRDSGRTLILVTGRELPDLFNTFSHPHLFDLIVAENGALLYWPKTGQEKLLANPPPPEFVNLLRERAISPLSVGRVILATQEPNEGPVLQAIRQLGLELQVIFNKGAVMILPASVNKATGLLAGLEHLGLSPRNIAGVGDAENDHAFLKRCECAVAVANALPALKQHADWVTPADHGAGVSQLIDKLLADDLEGIHCHQSRHAIHGPTAPALARTSFPKT